MGSTHLPACLVAVGMAVLCRPALPQGQDRPLPERESFLQQTREGLLTLDADQSRYVFEVTRREQSLDEDGRPTDEQVRTYESYPGLPGEERWERLIAEDGEPVPDERLAEQDQEREADVREAARARARDPEGTREEQVREWEEYQREFAKTVDDIFRVYDITMLGREPIGGHDTIAFTLKPRPDADPETDNGDRMRNFEIRAWVSESDHELVRVEAETIDVTTIWWGLLARIHPGSTISYERRKVNEEDWLPAELHYRGSARIALVRVIRRSSSSVYSDYRQLTEGTATSATRSGAVE